MKVGAYFKCSALSKSQPALLLFFSDFTAFSISSAVKGDLRGLGSASGRLPAFSFWKTCVKSFVISCIFPFLFSIRFPFES